MDEGLQVEVRAELAVDPHQQVPVERRGDAKCIIIGRDQGPLGLHHIDADQEAPAPAEQGARAHQEGLRLLRREIADGGAGEEAGDRPALSGGRQADRAGEILQERGHGERRIVAADRGGGLVEGGAADVDGRVDADLGGGVEQDPRLDAGAGAELDQGRAGRNDPGDLRRDATQERDLGAGRIVLRDLGDRLEQARALGVVEVFRRDRLLRLGEAREHVGLEAARHLGVGAALGVAGQADAGEHPALLRIEEVAVARPHVAGGGDAGAAAQHELAGHELAVVLADRAARRLEPRIGGVGAAGPFPEVAEHLAQPRAGGRRGGREPSGSREIAGDRQAFRGMLPFGLGGQARARPGRIGFRLIEADVADGGRQIERPQPVQGHRAPADTLVLWGFLPIERRNPVLGPGSSPALGEPEFRAPVTAVGHEGQPLGVGHQPVGELEGLQPDPVARAFVVEGEGSAGLRSGMADLHQAALEAHEPDGVGGVGRRGRGRPWRGVGRLQGRLGEEVQDVHQDQLLMLLLMGEAEVEELGEIARAVGQEPAHGLVDMRPVGDHVVERGPGEQAALGPGLPRPQRLVVGIEEIVEPRVEDLVAGEARRQQERLPEPGGVRQVPLGRAGVRHRLRQLVLGREAAGQSLGGLANRPVAVHGGGWGLRAPPQAVGLRLRVGERLRIVGLGHLFLSARRQAARLSPPPQT